MPRCLMCGESLPSAESVMGKVRLKFWGSALEFFMDNMKKEDVENSTDADMCVRCMDLVVACDDLMASYYAKLKICKELYAEKEKKDEQLATLRPTRGRKRKSVKAESSVPVEKKVKEESPSSVLVKSKPATRSSTLSRVQPPKKESAEVPLSDVLDSLLKIENASSDSTDDIFGDSDNNNHSTDVGSDDEGYDSKKPLSNDKYEDHSYVSKPSAGFLKPWSVTNPAYGSPMEYKNMRQVKGLRMVDVEGFAFYQYRFRKTDDNIRFMRCNHYRATRVQCMVKGAINLAEKKFFYDPMFKAVNHTHTTYDIPKGERIGQIRTVAKPVVRPPPAVRRARKNTVKKKFICDECDKIISTSRLLIRHYRAEHFIPDGPQCFECGRFFPTADAHAEHMNRHLHDNTDRVTCITCRSPFLKDALSDHILITHKGRIGRTDEERKNMGVDMLRCMFCRFKTGLRELFLHHVLIEHGNEENAFPCEKCGERLPTDMALSSHIAKKHALMPVLEKDYLCQACGIYFRTQNQYYNHKLKHKPLQGKKRCTECGKAFRGEILKDHMVTEHGRPMFRKCVECSELFETAPLLRRHKQVVHGYRPNTRTLPYHICEDCGRKFHRPYLYRAHRQKEHGEPLDVPVEMHPCSACSVVCDSYGGLRSHWKGAHGWYFRTQAEVGIECALCGSFLKEKNAFRDHLSADHSINVAAKHINPYVKMPPKLKHGSRRQKLEEPSEDLELF